MYSTRHGYIIGFHGCDQITRDLVINGKTQFKPSTNNYDWLGDGIYFWENNIKRALEFAQDLKNNPREGKQPVTNPSVLGAVISLGNCLDLLDSEYLSLLKSYHQMAETSAKTMGISLPQNINAKGTTGLLLRYLDCTIIKYLHKQSKTKFDSVRGLFFEGNELYNTSGFNEKNHIQICIRNPNCIKGFFIPRNLSNSHNKV